MRILVAHNRYQQSGGEDNVVITESELLRAHGHEVELLEANNDHIKGALSQVAASFTSIYSFDGKRRIEHAIAKARPDVVHVHNFFPTLSPSVFWGCAEQRVPVVHTLHNYRIVCAAATLFRDGHICEQCLEHRSSLPGIRHACYRGSRAGSAISGAGMAFHDRLGTWRKRIDAYIALTPFAAEKLTEFRIPRDKVHVKPNSSPDQGVGSGDGDFALFVGRLTLEKGVRTILAADEQGLLKTTVVLVGDGPLRQQVQSAAQRPGSCLKYLGFQSKREVAQLMQKACALLLPSLWHEGLPLVVTEALSMGLPIVAANLPNMASVIAHEETGLLFRPGSPESLAAGLEKMKDPLYAAPMRRAARAQYLRRYTPEINYAMLLAIYEHVCRSTVAAL